jgi:hypothetical protein
MAKIYPIDLVKAMSKKICMHSDTYFRRNKITGATFSGKICNPYDGPDSADQIAVKNRFKVMQANIRARIAALTATERAKLDDEFHAQTQIGTFYGYCYHLWNSEYDASGQLIGD